VRKDLRSDYQIRIKELHWASGEQSYPTISIGPISECDQFMFWFCVFVLETRAVSLCVIKLDLIF
jgi:hypothetical protein